MAEQTAAMLVPIGHLEQRQIAYRVTSGAQTVDRRVTRAIKTVGLFAKLSAHATSLRKTDGRFRRIRVTVRHYGEAQSTERKAAA